MSANQSSENQGAENQSSEQNNAGSANDESGTSGSAETIALDQFLKLAQVASSGGHAKALIQSGEVRVNGEVETRRGRKLRDGDRVEVEGEEFVIQAD
ncbi:MAG: RNA-binding S4 domain-containing protein [Planctomycetaceae bacterium]|nr:RNA-binding S4 domain-containing protein [Planctomycetaceae bacterium]